MRLLTATPLTALVLAACQVSYSINEVYVSPDGRELEFGVGSCNAEITADLYETATQVIVTIKVRNSSNDDCADSFTAPKLAEPLGDRMVIDGRNGRELEVVNRP